MMQEVWTNTLVRNVGVESYWYKTTSNVVSSMVVQWARRQDVQKDVAEAEAEAERAVTNGADW